MNALVANPNLLHQSMEKHLPNINVLHDFGAKSVLSKNNCFFLSQNTCFLSDLLMLGLMLGLMFPDAFFHFQHSCINQTKDTCQTLMFYLTLVRHVRKCILSNNNGFSSPNTCFWINFIDVGIDVGIDDSGSTFLMSSHNSNSNLPRYARMCESFTVALIMLRRNRNTTPALSPIRKNVT
jgi:hypothetical protein